MKRFNLTVNRGRLWIIAAVIAVLACMSTVTAAEPGWLGSYPPLAVVFEEIQTLAAARPDLVKLEIIGGSVEGRPLYGLHVGRKDGQDRPIALYLANIHAGEVISGMVAMGTLRRLVSDDGRDPWITSLLDRTDVYLVPILNPDGYHRVISTGGKGGAIGTRKNANGVDLNRNFKLVPGAHSRHPLAGNKRPRSSYYMGEAELSEPETQAVAALADQHEFYVSFMGHSVAGKVLYPHCFANVAPRHLDEYLRVGQAYADRQPTWKYKVQQSYAWYPTLGDSDDFLYVNHGTLAFTIEHGTVGHNLTHSRGHFGIFWIMNPHDLDAWVENDQDAVLAGIEQALEVTDGKPFHPAACRPERAK